MTIGWQFAQVLSPPRRHMQILYPFIAQVWLGRGPVLAIGVNADTFGKFELSVGAAWL